MKYVILVVGFLIIFLIGRKERNETIFGEIILIFLWLIYLLIWLIVFFVLDLRLPKVTL